MGNLALWSRRETTSRFPRTEPQEVEPTMSTVSQGTLRAYEAEPTTPSEGPGLMPGRWDTSWGGKIPPLPAPASGQEVGHRSFQQCTPPGWQPAALLRLLGTLLTLGVSMSPVAALQDAPESGGAPTTPSPPQCPPCGESCPEEWLSRNQSDLALLPATSLRCNARPPGRACPHRRPFHRRRPRGAQASPGRRRAGESLGHAGQIQRGPGITKTGVLYWEAQTASAAGKAPPHIRAAFPSNERRGPPVSFRRPLRLWYGGWRNAAGKHEQVGRGVPAGVPAKMHCGAPEEHGGPWALGRRCWGAQVVAGV